MSVVVDKKRGGASGGRSARVARHQPDRSIEFGGDNLILGPAYGSPFVTGLIIGRRLGSNSHSNPGAR